MIRTHKPRGYAWTCTSLFQQTPEFRNISYESCLIEDDSDIFAPSERSAKRRRVEKLADDFLNGYTLNIRSARLPPQAFQHAVARSFPRPKDARRAMSGIDVTTSADAVWEDVQDQWEILRDYNLVDDDEGQAAPLFDNDEVVIEVHAQASCTSARQQRKVMLATGPSDEALRQAAALRDRKLLRRSGRLSIPMIQRAQSEVMTEETQEDPSHSSLQATLSDIGPTPTAAWTSSKWLQSGMLELRHKAVDEECSKDELGLSSLPTPSQKAASRPAMRRGRSALSQRSITATTSISHLTGESTSLPENSEQSSIRTNKVTERSAATAYMLIPPSNSLEEVNKPTPDDESQEDSQAQLLRRQGIRVAPRKYWASCCATTRSSADSNGELVSIPSEEPAVSPAIRASVQESAKTIAKKVAKGKRTTKSTGAVPPTPARKSTRRKSAASESQAAADSMADLPVGQQHRMNSFRGRENNYMSVPAKDSSPFMFRKRVSKFNNDEDPDIEAIVVETRQQQTKAKTPRRVSFPSDSAGTLPTRATPKTAVPDPKTPLVNEYLNRLLPTTENCGSVTSSIKKAIRDEMRLAGAEFSRAEGEARSSQPGSGDPGEQEDAESTITANEAAPEAPPPQLWPGTQVLLAEAQKDLFNSPNKENPTLYLGDKTTPQPARGTPRRQPLLTLSQEHLSMPSTQALLDDWQGWSSIKKPISATGKRSSILPSPSSHRGSNLDASETGSSHLVREARKSTLRYSMSYNDSADLQQTESLPVAAFFPAQQSGLNRSTSSTSSVDSLARSDPPVQDQRRIHPSEATASSAAFTTQGQVTSTTELNTITSLISHADLSSRGGLATTAPRQQDSSISFSPIPQPQPQQSKPFPKPNPWPNQRTGLSTSATDQDAWSFSPLAPQSTVLHDKHIPTDFGPLAASMPTQQNAQIVGGEGAGGDASGRFLSQVDMNSQDIDATFTELMVDILGSAKQGMSGVAESMSGKL